MGRPLFSASFTNSTGSGDDLRLGATVVADEVRRWNEKDVDPEEDAWWTSKDIIIESFIDRPKASASTISPHVTAEPSTTTQPSPDIMAVQENNIDNDRLMQIVTTQIPNTIDVASLFPQRLTISEDELASVTLDSVVASDEDDDGDFELVWDDEEQVTDEELDMDVDETEAEIPHSDASTPAPSTPVTEPSHFMALPSTATSMHDFASHCMLPSLATPSVQCPVGSQATPRPTVRVRGFAVHSPRAELVL